MPDGDAACGVAACGVAACVIQIFLLGPVSILKREGNLRPNYAGQSSNVVHAGLAGPRSRTQCRSCVAAMVDVGRQ